MSTPKFLAVLALAGCTLLCACGKDDAPVKPREGAKPVSQGTIVAMGDSLTAGYGISQAEAYPAQLERKLNQAGYRWRVVNAGISGETSSGALARLDWVLKLKPDIVILETGANDGLRGQDLDLARKNIDGIVSGLQSKGVVVVLAGMRMLTNLGRPYGEKFGAIYPRVAKKRKVILVPFFLEKVAGEEKLNISDGIHPNAQGYAIVTENVYPYLLQAIKQKEAARIKEAQ